MIKKLYNKIRLYFINKNLNKLYDDIETKRQRIAWIKMHMHDVDVLHSTLELNHIEKIIEVDEMLINSYIQDRRRIMDES